METSADAIVGQPRTMVLRFGVAGLVSTGVHVSVAATLLAATFAGPTLANAIAICVATTCSYLLNTLWSFSAGLTRANLARFLAVSLGGLALTSAIAHTVAALGGHPWAGVAAVVVVVPPVTFLMHRYWTYR